jgi:hypothetical protein
LISFAVAICIFEVKDVRGRTNEQPAVIPDERGGPGKVFGEDRRSIHTAIAVCIFQHANAAEPFVAALGVIAHFHDEKARIFIETHGDRIGDERFSSDTIHANAGAKGESGKCVCGRSWGGAGEVGRRDGRFGGE